MKTIELLELTNEQQNILKARLQQHQRYSRITFRIVSATENIVTLQIKQESSPHENQFTAKRLREIGKETFHDMIGGRTLRVGATLPTGGATDIVTPGWLYQTRLKGELNNSTIAKALGINKSTVSAYIGGKKTLTQPVKAAFYYYYKSLGLVDEE